MKKVVVFLDDQEEKILNALARKYGGKAPAILKEALKIRFDKAFPAHKRVEERGIPAAKPADQEMTQEEICERLGGTVNKNHPSGPMCINVFGQKINAPLSLMGHKGEAGDYRIKK